MLLPASDQPSFVKAISLRIVRRFSLPVPSASGISQLQVVITRLLIASDTPDARFENHLWSRLLAVDFGMWDGGKSESKRVGPECLRWQTFQPIAAQCLPSARKRFPHIKCKEVCACTGLGLSEK